MWKTVRVACFGIGSVALLLLAICSYRYLSDGAAVDACLDRGGSYDYSAMKCDTQRSHEYVSYSARHPHDKTVSMIALGALVVCVTGLGWAQVAGGGLGEQEERQA